MSQKVDVGIAVGTQPPWNRINTLARFARILRAHSLWVVDHFDGWFLPELWTKDFSWLGGSSGPNAYYDYQVLLGALAPRAGNVQVAVGVTEPIRRHPVLLAQTFLTLSHMTKRPPILGIGSGEKVNVTQYGLSFERPVARLAEALEVIKRSFDGGPVSFAGEFYQLDRAAFELEAGRGGRPEIWIAAHGPKMLELTGRYGDGWFPTLPMTPEEYRASLDIIFAAAEKAGRSVDRFTPSMQMFAVLGPDRESARRMLSSPPVRYFALIAPASVWAEQGAKHPLGESFRGLVDFSYRDLTKDQLVEAMAAVPIDLLESTLVWGTPEGVVAEVRALAEAGLRHVVLAPISGLVSRRAALFAARSLPGMIRRLRSSN